MVNDTTESVTFPSNKTIILNLNGKTITGRTTNNGTLTITGTGTMQNTDLETIINNKTLTINSGTIKLTIQNNKTSKVDGLLNNGTVTMNGGNILGYEKTGTYAMWLVTNRGTFNFKAGTINLIEGNSTGNNGTAFMNIKTLNMSGGNIISQDFGLVIDTGTAKGTGGSITTYDNDCLLLRGGGKGEFISTSFTATGDGHAIYNNNPIANSCSDLIIRSRAANYGISGKIAVSTFGRFIATTNTSPGESSEKVTIYNTGCQYLRFPTWTEKNGQDDLDWMQSQNSSGTHTVTIQKSKHNNETGTYFVHIYESNANWDALDGLGNITLTF